MSVFVDELRARGGTGIFKVSCHLTAESEEELHEAARNIGMRREWFQPGRFPHYDLTASRHRRALRAGAIEITTKEWIRRRQARAAQPKEEA